MDSKAQIHSCLNHGGRTKYVQSAATDTCGFCLPDTHSFVLVNTAVLRDIISPQLSVYGGSGAAGFGVEHMALQTWATGTFHSLGQ